MKDTLIKIRNRIFRFFYKHFFKPIAFRFDPEFMHEVFTVVGRVLGSNSITRALTGLQFDYHHLMLEQTLLGIHFKNPVGLSAGFDKNAWLFKIMPCVGFGFEEVGSITGEHCTGNPKPRLWRHVKLQSIRVHMGLNNDGAKTVSKRLKNKRFAFPIGTSIAKTNCKETTGDEAGIADYVKAFTAFTEIGDYFTINLSCPNAYGGLPFLEAKKLDPLLNAIDQVPTQKPIFLKLGPDLSEKELDAILEVAKKHRVHGFIASNLSKQHSHGKGGVSGKLIEKKANRLIALLYKKTKGKYLIIGTGGIFSAEDAYEKIKLGASLVQLITGMIYEGPQLISEINQGLVKLLKRDGYKNLSEAVGSMAG